MILEEGTLGRLWSDVIHSGGGGERDSSVYKLFVAFSTVWRPTLYQRTVGVVVPAWGQILGLRAAVRKCGMRGCMVVPAERECLCAVCGKVEMCASHANGTCEACPNFEDPTPPALPVPEQMQVQLPQALTYLVLAKGSEALVWVEPMAGVPAFCRRHLDLGDPQCPMAHRTQPGFVAPGEAAYYWFSAGTILVVACRFSVLAYPLRSRIPNPDLHWWDMVPPGMAVMDATVATEYGWAQFYNSELWCKCGKVCACHATLWNVTQITNTYQKKTTNGCTKGVRKGYERLPMCTKGCTKGYTKGSAS